MAALVFRVRVVGPSMEPTLRNGRVAWARRGGVRPGRVGVFVEPGRPGLIVVKRIIRPGDGGWWVEGDAPEVSRDSRHYGPVPDEMFLGSLLGRR